MPVLTISATGTFGSLVSSLSDLASGASVLILGLGQSNLEGVPSTEAYTGAVPTKALYWDGSAFAPMVPGGAFRTNINPAISMIVALETAFPSLVFHYVEEVIGGEGFKNGAGAFATGNAGRVSFETKVSNAVTALEAAGTFYYLALLMNQGEAEMFNDANVAAYASQLASFFADTRALTIATLPTLLTRVSSGYTNPTAARRNAVRAVLETAGTAFVNTDDLPLQGDNTHQTAAGYVTLGQRYSAALSNFVPLLPVAALPPTPPAPSTLDVDFTSLSALPAGWDTTANTIIAFNNGLEIDTSVASDWGAAAVLGPVWDTARPLRIYLRPLTTENWAAGVSKLADWLSTDSYAAIRNSFYNGGTQVASYSNTGIIDLQVLLEKAGEAVTLSLIRQSDGTTLAATTLQIGTALAGARILLDPYADKIRVTRVVN